MNYAELNVKTNFTFLEGASHPGEYVVRAHELGLKAVGITDRNSLAGIVRAHAEAKRVGMRIIIGAQLDLEDGQSVVALPKNRAGYARLSRIISEGRRRAPKGSCEISARDVRARGLDIIFIALPPCVLDVVFLRRLEAWRCAFPGDVYCAMSHGYRGDDAARMKNVSMVAREAGVPIVATNDVIMHSPRRRALADVLTCTREGCTLDEAGLRVHKNSERHLKAASDMARLFADYGDAVARTVEIVERIDFTLDELRYEYPDEVSAGKDPQAELCRLVAIGLRNRYRGGAPARVVKTIEHELAIIKELSYAPYFLSVHDIVSFARGEGILCQGRGSAANSVVCFVLGITSVGPERMDMVFERFVSSARNEPPDIDVDFEHERREEVIQYIYKKYGRERAGLAATVISYRARSAIRDVGKALGLSQDTISTLASQVWGHSSEEVTQKRVREVGLDPDEPRLKLCLKLAEELHGFPRHLSQHVGGFVITRSRLDEIVPIENAAMEDRTVIEWDKDDLDTLGILKIDVLGLGMLSCIRKAFALLETHYGKSCTLASVPEGDDATYDMLCKGDSVGVFQVESRAQMAFLPRMRPRNFYDLVIEVAIIRPGPIQGDMVHPYLRRRNGEEKVEYPSTALRTVLERTLGVPLFQEQAMRIAIVGAGFSAEDADRLRRAMATFRKSGLIHTLRDQFLEGMAKNGHSKDFSERCFSQIEGFGEYGFPESHAASFALLVYVSSWLKCHYPAAFACALLNSQPMGFYAPAQIVRDAREHGVTVLAPDVNASHWDCTLERTSCGLALRLGFRQIKGMSEDDASWIVAARGNGYREPGDVWRRAGLKPATLKRLANADAFGSLALSRRDVMWEISAIKDPGVLPLFEAFGESDRGEEVPVILPSMSLGEQVVQDYRTLRLSLRAHPMALLRARMGALSVAKDLVSVAPGRRLSVAGLVLVRQRPGSAKGVVFLTLEDETGVANIIVWKSVMEKFRRTLMSARLIKVTGRLQREGIVAHIIAERLENLSGLLDTLGESDVVSATPAPRPRPRHPREQAKALFPSRDFH